MLVTVFCREFRTSLTLRHRLTPSLHTGISSIGNEHQLDNLERHQLNLETAEIVWSELQRHFASGHLISVHPKLDLVDVAFHFAKDNRAQIESWFERWHVHPVTDEQARQWHLLQASLWAVVVKPWVLVQARDQSGR